MKYKFFAIRFVWLKLFNLLHKNELYLTNIEIAYVSNRIKVKLILFCHY